MFTVRSDKKKKRYVDIYRNEYLLYHGKWDDLPLQEDIIIEKSISFFNDPTPCFIHRDAVRIRLLTELEAEIKHDFYHIPPWWLNKLAVYTGIFPITRADFSEK